MVGWWAPPLPLRLRRVPLTWASAARRSEYAGNAGVDSLILSLGGSLAGQDPRAVEVISQRLRLDMTGNSYGGTAFMAIAGGDYSTTDWGRAVIAFDKPAFPTSFTVTIGWCFEEPRESFRGETTAK